MWGISLNLTYAAQCLQQCKELFHGFDRTELPNLFLASSEGAKEILNGFALRWYCCKPHEHPRPTMTDQASVLRHDGGAPTRRGLSSAPIVVM
jgi:hypothetical protein